MSIVTNDIRPNRLTDLKDAEYHNRYARWAIGAIKTSAYNYFQQKTLVNRAFYKGNQWIFDEDLASFLEDESGEARNRIRFIKNVIKPLVLHYKGNAVRIKYAARAQAFSHFAITRRETELGRAFYAQGVAGRAPAFAQTMAENFPIGETAGETEEMFENTWQDEYEGAINGLIVYEENVTNFESTKVELAEHLATSGLGVLMTEERNGEQVFDIIDPISYFWDPAARKPDLSDSSFMGHRPLMEPADIFEGYQGLQDFERKAIENYSKQRSNQTFSQVWANYFSYTANRVPVYCVYWKDTVQQEWGYVKDPFDYDYFTRINHEDGEYTTKDLIESESKAHQKVLKGKKSAKIFLEEIRFCKFIPKEEIGSRDLKRDIMLEYGVMPYSESDYYRPSEAHFPYKCGTWSYCDGEILSPLDDAISPQRFINRLISVTESQVNNSGGSGVAISADAIDPQDGEDKTRSDINKGRMIKVDTTRTGNIQNTVGRYDGMVSPSVFNYLEIANQMNKFIQDTTGVNESMTGTEGGQRELVGAIESRIQRGNLLQEPFFFALTQILEQAYKSIGTLGKRIYADNPRELAIRVGDRAVQSIIITKDIANEEFRISIERTVDDGTQEQYVTELMLKFMEFGIIKDPKVFADLFNRATVGELAKRLRVHWKDMSEVQKMKAKKDAENTALLQQQITEQQRKEEATIEKDKLTEQIESGENRQLELDKITLRDKNQQDKEKLKASLKT